MAELNLRQIEDKLNTEFTGDGRKLIFWYDDSGEFVDDIKNLKLKNAKIHLLNKTNTFYTKVLLEREDVESNYLIYAPFAKPNSRENHLADTVHYSKEFSADRSSLILADLGIDSKYKKLFDDHITLFRAKKRTHDFYKLVIDDYNQDTIEIGFLCVLTNVKSLNFDEVVRVVITEGSLEDNRYLKDFESHGLLDIFWKQVSRVFAYRDLEPNLTKFVIALFTTYAKTVMNVDLDKSFEDHVLDNSGTVMTFMDQIMNSRYTEKFDDLSDQVFRLINGKGLFKDLSIDDYIDLDIFRYIDEQVIIWIYERLLDENLNSSVDGNNIVELCRYRENKHFRSDYLNQYHLLRHAFHIINQTDYKAQKDVVSIVKKYDEESFIIDTHYRKFYYYLDKSKEHHKFESLQNLVENIYTNKYLDVITHDFNEVFDYDELRKKYKLQRNFYRSFVSETKEMLVVIISDALRYEIGKELVKKLERDAKVESVEIEPQIGVLPSITSFGMAALLPNQKLSYENGKVFVNEKATVTLKDRKAILQSSNPDADCIQYSDLMKYNSKEQSEFFVGKSLVYIYHNQIDIIGDSFTTQDDVFSASAKAIEEIHDLIIRLTNSVSRTRFIVTADHGFIYKRNKLVESDKNENFMSQNDQISKRYSISESNYDEIGSQKMFLSESIDEDNKRYLYFPTTSNIFKAAGGGQNFVHGGRSPQELLTPVIQVKTIRGAEETRTVEISLISSLTSINGLISHIEFIQKEPISDVVKPTTYKIAFENESGEIISNQEIYVANSKEDESAKRIFRLRFNLKNQQYKRDDKYFLVVIDDSTGVTALRKQVTIDIAFGGDFGFSV